MLGRAFRQPMGVELMLTGALTFGQSSQYYDLTGLSLTESLDKLVSFLPDYAVTTDRGVVHFQPKALAADPGSWLNQKITKIDQHWENLSDALRFVAAIQGAVPSAQTGRGAPPISAAPPGIGVTSGVVGGIPSNPMADRMKASITLSLTDVTIRDVLDEIARQANSFSWAVDHRPGPNTTMSLTFTGFDGWSAGAAIR